MAPEIRCRVTMNLPGGARPGDVVLVDPTDPWMASKIGPAGALVPLDGWTPEATDDTPAASDGESGGAADGSGSPSDGV